MSKAKEVAEEVISNNGLLNDLNGDRRAKIYSAMKPPEVSPEEETSEEVLEDPVEPSIVEEPTGDPINPSETDDSTDKESTPDDSTDKGSKKKQKTVPLAALHEERELHKTTRKRVSELESQLSQVVTDYRAIVELQAKAAEPKVDLDAMDETERKIYLLEQENKQLRNSHAETQQSNALNLQQQVDKLMQEVDKELTEKGFPGFIDMRYAIADEMAKAKLINDELPKTADLKRVYTEIVYPRNKKRFLDSQRKRRDTEKEECKQDAELTKKPGKQVKQSKEETKHTFEDYLNSRNTIV